MADKLYFTVMLDVLVHTGEDPITVEEQLAERLGETGDIEAGFVVVLNQKITLKDAK